VTAIGHPSGCPMSVIVTVTKEDIMGVEELLLDLIDMVKRHKKEHPELSDEQLKEYIGEVMEDAIATGGISMEDYEIYKDNPNKIKDHVLEETKNV